MSLRLRAPGAAGACRAPRCLAPCRAHGSTHGSRAPISAQQQRQQQEQQAWAAAALAAALLACSPLSPPAAWAEEGVGDGPLGVADAVRGFTDARKQKLQAADDSFKQSDTLRQLLEKSEANRAKNKRAIENKYCARQAEMGVGDCGGLRFIPGATKNGKQVTPEFLKKALGVDEIPKVPGEGKTLADLLGPEAVE